MATQSDTSKAESVCARVLNAVEHLATGAGDFRTRLQGVGMELMPFQARDFPDALQAEYDGIMHELTKREAVANEGTLEATLQQMDEATGREIARRVFRLYGDLQDILRETYAAR
jgi:hypothetical protein